MTNLKISNDVRLIDFVILIILAIVWFAVFELSLKEPRALTHQELQDILKMSDHLGSMDINIKRIADQMEIDLK